MCVKCMMQRMKIVMCKPHSIRRLGPAERISSDMPNAYGRLCRNELEPTDHWCSFCPAAAVSRCCLPQAKDIWGVAFPPSSPLPIGCGLNMCELCFLGVKECGGVEEFIKVMTSHQRANGEVGCWPRPDVELLSNGGLLVRNISARMLKKA